MTRKRGPAQVLRSYDYMPGHNGPERTERMISMLKSAQARIPCHNTPGSAISTSLGSVFRAVRAAIARRRTRVALDDLDEHVLNDIGIRRLKDPFRSPIDAANWR